MREYLISKDTFMNGGEVDISANYYPGARSPSDKKSPGDISMLFLRRNGLDYEVVCRYHQKRGLHGKKLEEVLTSTRDPDEFVKSANEMERIAMHQIGATDDEITVYVWVPDDVVDDIKSHTKKNYASDTDLRSWYRSEKLKN